LVEFLPSKQAVAGSSPVSRSIKLNDILPRAGRQSQGKAGNDARYFEPGPLTTIHFKQPQTPPVKDYIQEELQRLLTVCDLDIINGAFFAGIRNKALILLFLASAIWRAEQTIFGKATLIWAISTCAF
jgi:hypothetical protein